MRPILAYITAPNQEEAKKLAKGILEKKLAACVNLMEGTTSLYEWQGEMQENSEVILLVKTTAEKFAALKEYVIKSHSYECPCILSFAVQEGHLPFLQWIQNTLEETL